MSQVEPSVPAPETDTLAAALARHQIPLAPNRIEHLDRYCRLLWDWNSKINLTRHTTYELFVSRDVLDAFHFASCLAEGEEVTDVGTGGGMPGLILAIMRPDLKLTLIDSVEKKAIAVKEMAKELRLPVQVLRDRIQDLIDRKPQHTLVIRAVAPLSKLLLWFKGNWSKFHRLLVVKGSHWREECEEAREKQLTGRLKIHRACSYTVPGTGAESVILEIMPTGRQS